jgi:class 3 adenylate cyclase
MRHTSIRYGCPAQVFPWATVALLLILVPVAWVMVDLPSRSWRLALDDLQESIGVALLTLTVIRLAWRLNWQTFRTLFRSDLIGQTEGIGVRDVTILFTDLVGSTTLYAQIGDRSAFSLVQQHFYVLEGVTVAHRGMIVKTIGDAVMAAFSSPDDAVRAALAMLEATEPLNAGFSERAIVLKIGLHRGAAIAVTMANRLDYFGQTVNIAARMQETAAPEEICLSAAVHDDPGVKPLLDRLRVTAQSSRFRGMDRELWSFRITRAAPA